MKTLLDIAFALGPFLISLFFLGSAAYVISSDVWPAIENGSLTVETSSTILNHTWHGNDIYILLAAYILLAIAFAFGAIRLAHRARGH